MNGLRDGLAMSDRQRRVVIGVGFVLGRHQQVARDGAHRVEHRAVDLALAPLTPAPAAMLATVSTMRSRSAA